MDDGVVGPSEFGGVAVLDAVIRVEDGVQHVTCDVRGVVSDLGETDVLHVVEEGGGVVDVKVEVPEEYVVIGVYGERGDEVGDEVAEA